MFWPAKRDFSDAIYTTRRAFESLALRMCHFFLDVHGRARIIACILFKLCDYGRGRTARVVRIELLE